MFRRPKTRPRPADDLEAKLERALVTLEGLANQVAELELTSARARELETEWLDMYEKFRNLYGRIAKRIQREEPSEAVTPTPQGPRITNPAALALFHNGRPK